MNATASLNGDMAAMAISTPGLLDLSRKGDIIVGS